MDPTEAFAQQYLANLRLGPVVFEPDGNIPPDFVIDGRIAVEVRRLNQIYDNAKKATGLEEEDIPLYLHMRKLLRSFGPPTGPTSLAVSYRFARPLGRWKILESSITNILKQFSTDAPATRTDYKITPTFTLVLTPLSIKLADRFRLTGMSDEDSGGMLLDLMRQSLALVVPEKARKIVPYRDRYREWWLLLVDYIGLGLSDFERDLFQENVRIAHDWNRLLLLSPIDTTRVIEIPR